MDTDVKLFGLPPQVRMHSSAAAMTSSAAAVTASFQVVAAGHFLLLVLQILRHPRTDRHSLSVRTEIKTGTGGPGD